MTARLFNWKTEKIIIYPLGGLTKFNDKINKPIIEELLVNIMGPVFQIIFTNFFTLIDENALLFSNSLLVFNLLPIVPLDGGKLLNIVLSLFKPLKKSMNLIIKISYFTYFLLLLFILKIHSLFFILVVILLFIKIIEESKKIDYYYNKFIVERLLYNFRFKRSIMISDIKKMYKYKNNIFKKKNTLYTEKEYIKNNCK